MTMPNFLIIGAQSLEQLHSIITLTSIHKFTWALLRNQIFFAFEGRIQLFVGQVANKR